RSRRATTAGGWASTASTCTSSWADERRRAGAVRGAGGSAGGAGNPSGRVRRAERSGDRAAAGLARERDGAGRGLLPREGRALGRRAHHRPRRPGQAPRERDGGWGAGDRGERRRARWSGVVGRAHTLLG